MVMGVDYNVPTVDGDFMGRAYPRLYIMTPFRESHLARMIANKALTICSFRRIRHTLYSGRWQW